MLLCWSRSLKDQVRDRLWPPLPTRMVRGPPVTPFEKVPRTEPGEGFGMFPEKSPESCPLQEVQIPQDILLARPFSFHRPPLSMAIIGESGAPNKLELMQMMSAKLKLSSAQNPLTFGSTEVVIQVTGSHWLSYNPHSSRRWNPIPTWPTCVLGTSQFTLVPSASSYQCNR